MTQARPRIALSLVTTRRPTLLARTLDSFDAALFRQCDIGDVFVNLDPVFGNDADHAEVLSLIRQRFPDASIRETEAGSFGHAVQWVWSQLPDGPVLHLEEDWIALEDIDVIRAVGWLTGNVTAVNFKTFEHGRKAEREFSTARDKRYLFGVIRYLVTVPRFNTSPGIFDGAFLRACAARMDPTLDPEKQMRPSLNPALYDFLLEYRCRFLKASDGGPLIEDIGRHWREDAGIERAFVDGKPQWHKTGGGTAK